MGGGLVGAFGEREACSGAELSKVVLVSKAVGLGSRAVEPLPIMPKVDSMIAGLAGRRLGALPWETVRTMLRIRMSLSRIRMSLSRINTALRARALAEESESSSSETSRWWVQVLSLSAWLV